MYKKHFKIYFFIWELCHPSNTRWLVLTLLLFSQKLVFPSDKVGANKSERTFSPNYIWGRVYFTIHLCHCGWKDSKTVQITRVLYAVSHVLNFWSLQRGFKLLPGPRPCHTLVAPSSGLAPKLHQGRNNSRQKRAHELQSAKYWLLQLYLLGNNLLLFYTCFSSSLKHILLTCGDLIHFDKTESLQ